MGAYSAMELNAMAAMLYGQRAEPWHASADIWGSASQQLLATHGDLGAANAVIKTWPQSVGSLSQAAFNGQVVASQASLAEWTAYTGAMSAALRLGGISLHAAQAIMPAVQSSYDTAVALSSVPFIGPIAAQAAMALQAVGAGMMEAVGAVMQAPTAVPAPAQGWQGPGGSASSTPSSPIPAVSPDKVLDGADKLMGLMEKGTSLAQTVMGLTQSGGLDKIGDLGSADLPGLAGGSTTTAPVPSAVPTETPSTSGVSPALIAGGGALGVAGGAGLLQGARGGGGQFAAGVPGARLGIGTEPALAGGAARAAAGAGRATPAIAPPISPLGGGGAGEVRSGTRSGAAGHAASQTGEQEKRLLRNGVQAELQGRAAREQAEQFGRTSGRRRWRTTGEEAGGDAVLDEEIFIPPAPEPAPIFAAEPDHDRRRD